MTRAPHVVLRFIACAMFASAPLSAPLTTPANHTRDCVDRFDAAVDYFPEKSAIEDATNFSVEYRRSYKVLTVKGGAASDPIGRHVLVQCGTPVPPLVGDLAGAQVIQVPVASLFTFSTTQLPALVDLERVDVITGVAQRDAVRNPAVQARIKSGQVIEFARVGLVIDVERVVTAKPSLLMAGTTTNPALAVIRTAGIPVVGNAEWLERSALGRAEWLKYVALFLNEERKAQALYGATKDRYRALAAKTNGMRDVERPLVMTGRSTRGVFSIAGGASYVAAFIKDAGGRYAWADNAGAGFVSVDFEAQLQRAADADMWINGGGWANRAAMIEDEPRYAAFKAFRSGQVWVYERGEAGASRYWSQSVTHPDIVLADLLKIFHPALAADHAFEWYMPVPAK